MPRPPLAAHLLTHKENQTPDCNKSAPALPPEVSNSAGLRTEDSAQVCVGRKDEEAAARAAGKPTDSSYLSASLRLQTPRPPQETWHSVKHSRTSSCQGLPGLVEPVTVGGR